MSIDRYIETLPLADVTRAAGPFGDHELTSRTTRGGLRGPAPGSVPEPIPADLQAAVNAGSLLSFVAGVSAEEKDDVLFSIQLAQRGASETFDRFTQTQAWYQKYVEVLENIGWAAEQLAFARCTDHRRRFLFWSWGAQQVNFWTTAQKLTFNAALYAPHRELVQRRLGAAAAHFIAALALG
jgi:hypothetical protein